MRVKISYQNIGLLVLAMILTMTGCKSPGKKSEEVLSVPSKDTIAVEIAKDTVPQPVAVDTTRAQKPLTLIVSNLVSDDAPVIIGVYGPKNDFLNEKDQLKVYKFVPKGKTLTAQIKDLSYGDFAMAIYQDVNSNGKIDKNGIGVPKEPYAFSNNYKPVIKAPNFKNCQFSYNKDSNTVKMKMIR
jgi:uncharacterized protein (DUF2141 family)